MTDGAAGREELLRRLRDEIRSDGPISFARFMDIALNEPVHGYYAQGAGRLGPTGDFFTAGDVGSAFGESLARFLAEQDRALLRPRPFRYVEYGAGRGRLARDVLDTLRNLEPDLASRCEIVLADTSAGMRAEAAATCPEAAIALPTDVPSGGAGCVVAVELLDALPVHRVRRRGGTLMEVRIALDGLALAEIETEADSALSASAAAYGTAPRDGDEAEVCLALAPAVGTLASAIDRGFLVVVDYGHEAERLARPEHRRGTLLAYSRHAVHEDYLTRVGEQDLTAHVNLTMLRQEAGRLGLRTLGVTTQDRFLIANGILDGLDEAGDSLAATKRRLRAKQLVHPDGMGRAFKVAVFSKGIEPPPELPGLRDPFA